ncbi:MAG: hypothetical protein DCC68_26800 [Planctomycetota bacterium]|nr:MAG: hypothetical protein DCC68_26800 [Planctomycetota bacterium]
MQRDVVLTESPQGLTTIADAVCTSVCTSDTENANAGDGSTADSPIDGSATNAAAVGPMPSDERPSDALAALAAAIASLSVADRAALVAVIGQAAPSSHAPDRAATDNDDTPPA